MARVLITGASGHLGQTLAKQLLAQDYEVIAGVRKLEGDARVENLRNLGCDIQRVDVLDKQSVVDASRGVAGIFHLAAIYNFTPDDGGESLTKTAIEGSQNILSAALENGVESVIMTSSTVAVGSKSTTATGLDENHWNTDSQEPYSAAKCRAELQAYAYVKDKPLRLVTILPSAILGPGFYQHTPTTIQLALALKRKLPAIAPFNFSFVDVRDVAIAHINAFENKNATGRYIVSSSFKSMKQLFEAIKTTKPGFKLPKIQLPRVILPFLPHIDLLAHKLTGTPRLATKAFVDEFGYGLPLFNSQRAIQELGWQGRPFEETVKDTVNWIEKKELYF